MYPNKKMSVKRLHTLARITVAAAAADQISRCTDDALKCQGNAAAAAQQRANE